MTKREAFAAISITMMILAFYLAVVSSDRFGGYYDDAIYLTLAKSLATGQGYHIISLPQRIPEIMVPPLYPAVLSVIWRLKPAFPGNLIWFMLFSVAAMATFYWMCWRYLVVTGYTTERKALVAVVLASLSWHTMLLGTSILSEALFAPLSVGALCLTERLAKQQRGRCLAVGLGLVLGLVFLTRTSGVTLLVAVAVYFVIQRRPKTAVLPIAIGLVFVAFWFGWSYLNKGGGVGGEHASYYAGYTSSFVETVERLSKLSNASTLTIFLRIVASNATGLILIWAPFHSLNFRLGVPIMVLLPFVLAAFTGLGFVKQLRQGARPLHIFIGVYLVLHLVLPVYSYDRYLMPILPFLLMFLVTEIVVLASTLRSTLISNRRMLEKGLSVFVGVVVFGFAGVGLFDNFAGVFWAVTELKEAPAIREEAETIDWIRASTRPSDVLACFGDHKYYLFTGRKAVRSASSSVLTTAVYQQQHPDPEAMAMVFSRILSENHCNYLILNETDFKYQAPTYGEGVIREIGQHPDVFVLVHESPGHQNKIYRINQSGTALGLDAPK
jgi:4-amino-4-deoxy-L-arabinose transferase-like glycosyltransferase